MFAPIWIPVMLLIAVGIKFLSRGPILFKQERIGRGGRLFMCFKFRSMRVNASTSGHQEHLKTLMRSNVPMMKMDAIGDSRVIPLGGLLRASGLDELPQIFNVWRGEMSLVGPRPCTPYEYSEYLPSQKERFNALPGITGLWQVSGKNKTTFEQMVNLDIEYTRNQSVSLDLQIMLKTLPVLLGQLRDALARRFFRRLMTVNPILEPLTTK